MTGQVGAESGPQPPRSRWAGKPLAALIVLITVALALGGAWWLDTSPEEPAADGPKPTSAITPDPWSAERTRPTGQPSAAPLPPISGMTVDAVAAGWAQRWGTPPKASARGYDTTAVLPGTTFLTRFGVLKSPVGDGTQVATLFCVTTDERIVRDERLIQAIVDTCLAPALQDDEKTTLSTWLTKQDYSHDAYADQELARFHANLVSAADVFQVLLVSKGRTVGPGSYPTTAG